MAALPRFSAVSIVLIAISCVVAANSNLGKSLPDLAMLFISDPRHTGFTDIMQGQLWRLITPIFVHFGVLHLLFNMIWVWDLGKLIEARKGVVFYIVFVLIAGVASNLAQYLFTDSPYFGGMSGVLYGLLGYIWIQGRTNPAFGFMLTQSTVIMMGGWFVLCWTGLLGPIANWAHTAGLIIGVVWGFLDKSSR
ncbi:MAG TPA: rhomboid family intramembrane serine protease [Usitatibacteraceae bacterium]